MIQFTLRGTYDSGNPGDLEAGLAGIDVGMEFRAESLDLILPQFADFLRGLGFTIDGDLEVVSEEE